MKATEAIRDIMDKHEPKLKVGDLAFTLGTKSRVIWDRLSQENISVAKLDELARAVGYKIVLVPKDARVADGSYRIE